MVLREEIEVINQADTFIYTTENSLKDMKGKVDEKQLEQIKTGVEELKTLMKAENKDIQAIKKKLEEVTQVAQKAATEMYQKSSKQQETTEKPKDENVVDAEVVDEKQGEKA